MQLEVHHQTDQEIYATWGPVLIRICDGAATETEDIDRLHALFEALLSEWPTIGMLLVSHHGTPSPSVFTLRYTMNTMAHLQDRFVVGVALLGLGYWADTSRATVAWLMRLVRGNTFALESTVDAAVQRMALEMVGFDVEGLCSAYVELDRRFRSH